ncbi:hypothetical protein D3C79_653490 [compost metagenome]
MAQAFPAFEQQRVGCLSGHQGSQVQPTRKVFQLQAYLPLIEVQHPGLGPGLPIMGDLQYLAQLAAQGHQTLLLACLGQAH